MGTSGTVQTYPYKQRKVIEHAMRRAGKLQTALTSEWIEIAQDLIFTTLGEWLNAGHPVWTKQYALLGVQRGSADVPTPAGTNSVRSAYWRALNPYRGPAVSTSGSDVSVLFGGAPSADVTIPGPNAGVIVNFGSATQVDTVGILLGDGASVTGAVQVFVSLDGVNFTLNQTLPSTTYVPGQWQYFDFDPSLFAASVKIIFPGGTGSGVPILTETGLAIETEAGQNILTETGGTSGGALVINQLNLGLAGGDDLKLGDLNRDDYYDLPDRSFVSERPNSVYVDRPIGAPVLRIWPVPNLAGFYNGCVAFLGERYIQDPGEMTDNIEVQSRMLEALQWRLAQKLIYELPDDTAGNQQPSYFSLMAKQQRVDNIEKNVARAELLAWAEERTGGPIRIAPNISGYTR